MPFGWEYKRKGGGSGTSDRFGFGFLTSPQCLPSSFQHISLSLLSGEERGKGKECFYGVPLTALLATAVVLSVHALALGKWATEQFL